MTKVVIVHGYTGSPDKNWFPWLKQQLEAKGIKVLAPQMPNPDAPKLEEWLGCLDQLDITDLSDTYMVGHSLGCAAILRYVEKFAPDQVLAGAVFVAGFAEPLSIPEISNFVTGPWNDEKIKISIKKIAYFSSDNDPYMSLEKGRNMKKRFGGELIEVHNAGHFNWRDGYKELPVVYDKLQEMIGF